MTLTVALIGLVPASLVRYGRLKLRAGSDSGVSPGGKVMLVDSFWSVHHEYLREEGAEGERKLSTTSSMEVPKMGIYEFFANLRQRLSFLLTASVPVDLPVKCLQRQVP